MQRELIDIWSSRLGKREAVWIKVEIVGVGRRGLEYIWEVEFIGYIEGWYVGGQGKGDIKDSFEILDLRSCYYVLSCWQQVGVDRFGRKNVLDTLSLQRLLNCDLVGDV